MSNSYCISYCYVSFIPGLYHNDISHLATYLRRRSVRQRLFPQHR